MINCLKVIGDKLVVFRNSKCVHDIVYALTQVIPLGKVTTYSSISELLGVSPRYVARVLSGNRNPIAIPCHRVVRSDRRVGGYTLLGRRMDEFKVKLLMLEGVRITNGKVSKEYVVTLSELI